MPASTPKDLYLATNIGELNKKAEIPTPKVVNARAYVKTAKKLIADAARCCSLGDEEKSYILYMRYLEIVRLVRTSSDYKKQKDYYDSLIGRNNLRTAIDKAEDLSTKLKERYDLKEAEAVCQKLDAIVKEKEEKKKEEKEVDVKKEPDGEKNEKDEKEVPNGGSESETGLFNSGALSPNQLYNLLLEPTNQLIVMDVRSSAEFANSHMKHSCVMKVPCDIVTPGLFDRDNMTDSNPSAPPPYQESGPPHPSAVTSPPYPQPGPAVNAFPTEPPPQYEPPKGQPGVNYGYNTGYNAGTQPQYPPQGYQTVHSQPQPVTVIQGTRCGPHTALMDCPFCHSRINTTVLYETGALTWLVSGLLCLFGCWLGCCLIPFCVNDLQDVIHKCPNCQQKVGIFRRLN